MCPPIGASFKESRYLLHSPPLLRPTSWRRKELQRTMSALFSLLRFKRLQFELCNLTRCRTRPVTQPQEGGTYTRTIVQTVHAETTPTCSHFPLLRLLRYYFQPSSLFLCVPAVCLLSQGRSLIIVLLSTSKQDTLYCWYLSSESRVSMQVLDGPPRSWFTCMQGFCLGNWANESNNTPAPERARRAQRDEQMRIGKERVSRKVPGSLRGVETDLVISPFPI